MRLVHVQLCLRVQIISIALLSLASRVGYHINGGNGIIFELVGRVRREKPENNVYTHVIYIP